MTEPLLLQQLESPSGTGRFEPRSHLSLPGPTNQQRDPNPQIPFSLAHRAHPTGGGCGRCTEADWPPSASFESIMCN